MGWGRACGLRACIGWPRACIDWQRACRWAEGVYVGWGRVGGLGAWVGRGRVGGLGACRWAGVVYVG